MLRACGRPLYEKMSFFAFMRLIIAKESSLMFSSCHRWCSLALYESYGPVAVMIRRYITMKTYVQWGRCIRRMMRSGKFPPERKAWLGRADEKGHKRRKDGGSSSTRLQLGEILKKSWIRNETSLNNGLSNPKTWPANKSGGWRRIPVELTAEVQNLSLLRHVRDLVK